MPVGRVVVVPLVVVMSIPVSMPMSVRIFGLLLLFSVAIVTITAHAIVPASLPWSAGLLASATAAASTSGLVRIVVVAPPSVPLRNGIGTAGRGIVPCHWLCLFVSVAWGNASLASIFALPS